MVNPINVIAALIINTQIPITDAILKFELSLVNVNSQVTNRSISFACELAIVGFGVVYPLVSR